MISYGIAVRPASGLRRQTATESAKPFSRVREKVAAASRRMRASHRLALTPTLSRERERGRIPSPDCGIR
jgi:hypothetical protein